MLKKLTFLIAFVLIAWAARYLVPFIHRAIVMHQQHLRRFSAQDASPHCGRWRDTMPRSRPEVPYRLYIAARNLWRSKYEYALTKEEGIKILDTTREAARAGDWGARAMLAHLYLYGLGPLDTNLVLSPDESQWLEIIRSAVDAGQAWGFYDLGVGYENGYGGLRPDSELAWSYYQKAAELGSPEAQLALAKAYYDADRLDEGTEMLNCAYRNGSGLAAYKLGISALVTKQFDRAFNLFQDGLSLGNQHSAAALMLLFGPSGWRVLTDGEAAELRARYNLPDPERERRYSLISNTLKFNPDLRLRHLERLVPPPPEPLPPWRGIEAGLDPSDDEIPHY